MIDDVLRDVLLRAREVVEAGADVSRQALMLVRASRQRRGRRTLHGRPLSSTRGRRVPSGGRNVRADGRPRARETGRRRGGGELVRDGDDGRPGHRLDGRPPAPRAGPAELTLRCVATSLGHRAARRARWGCGRALRAARPPRHRDRRRRPDRPGRLGGQGRRRRPHAREDRGRGRRPLRGHRLLRQGRGARSRPPVPLELLAFGLPATLRALGAGAAARDAPLSPDGGVIADYLGAGRGPRRAGGAPRRRAGRGRARPLRARRW